MKVIIVNQGMGECLLGEYHQPVSAPIPQKDSVMEFKGNKYRVVTCEYLVKSNPENLLRYPEVTLFVNNL